MRAKGLAPATIKGYLKHLHAALQWAVDIELISEVPAMRLPKVKQNKLMRSRPVTLEEYERMVDCAQKHDPDIVLVMHAGF